MALTREDINLLNQMAKDKNCCVFSKSGAHQLEGIIKKVEVNGVSSPAAFQRFQKIIGNALQSCANISDPAMNALNHLVGVAAVKNEGGFFYNVVNRCCSDNLALANILINQRKLELLTNVVKTMGKVCKNEGADAILERLEKKVVREDGHYMKIPAEMRARINQTLIATIPQSRAAIIGKK